jgi:uncharacterized protein (DUF169 family)
MNEIRAFERRMGGRWTGVSFHRQIPRDTRKVDQSMPFCKAVTVSNTGALTLAREDINCPGAWRSFGWQSEVGSSFMDKIIRRTGFSQPVAEKLIRETPAIDDADIVGVTVGDYETPDILISYLQPAHAMRFLLLWQAVYQSTLDVSISSVMAVCGSVAAGAYSTQKVCCSFGCPESRRQGGIGRDRLAIGIPTGLLREFS